jgi:hypothetical protein
MPKLIYDLETYRELFLFVCTFEGTDQFAVYECSRRRNDAAGIRDLVMGTPDLVMVGFNSLTFDYPIVHWLIGAIESGETERLGGAGVAMRCHELGNAIIGNAERHAYTVWPRHQLAPQLDLMRVHHMDNAARRTSLKALQCAMRSPSVVDLPIAPGADLSEADMDTVIRYGVHDVQETARFLALSADAVRFRESLGTEFLATSDAGIGKKILRTALEQVRPGCTARGTWRDKIELRDIILPGIAFTRRPFTEMLARFQEMTVDARNVKGSFPDTRVFEAGLSFKFGLGGLHGSRNRVTYRTNDEYEIVDVDVTSYYPTLALANGLAPEHLHDVFGPVYQDLFDRRMATPKSSPDNKALKLCLNGVFGDSGSEHSPFLDVAFMLGITVNGQLFICMLAEALSAIQGVEIIQVNTDGVTLYMQRDRRDQVDDVLSWWQTGTRLKLEESHYETFWIRDVNNYLALKPGGAVKRTGAYEHEKEWWEDPSALCIARATEQCLLTGVDPATAIRDQLASDPWGFLLRVRAKGRDQFECGGFPVQKTVRYYLSATGLPLVKIMPPLPGKETIRRNSIQKGQLVRLANTFDGSLIDVDLNWYTREVVKLVNGVR